MTEHGENLVTEESCGDRHASTNRLITGIYLLLTVLVVPVAWSTSIAWSESSRVSALEKSDAVQATTFEYIKQALDELKQALKDLKK